MEEWETAGKAVGRAGTKSYPDSVKPAKSEHQTSDEQYAAVVAKVRALGFRVPPRGAWRKRIGAMQGSVYFDEAVRLGAEWRAEVNRKSLEELNADP